MSFEHHDLGMGRRKAKIEFYSFLHASLMAIADYDEERVKSFSGQRVMSLREAKARFSIQTFSREAR